MSEKGVRNGYYLVTILFFFFLPLILAQETESQISISLQATNQPLRSLLQEISNQSGTSFIFDDGLVDGEIVTCEIENAGLRSALTMLLAQTSLSYRILSDFSVVLFQEGKSTGKQDNGHADRSMIPPVLQENIEPAYPPLAQTEGMEGTVTMNLLVGEAGAVKRVEIVQSSGYRILDNAATVFARRLKFNPAKQGDKPIDAWISWVLDYHLVAQEFLPIRYAQKVKELRSQIARKSPNKHPAIQKEVLNNHLEFVEYMSSKKPGLIYNKYIRELIAQPIYDNWKLFWEDFPLQFLVFHDFIRRYPDSEFIQSAKSHLFYYIDQILDRYKKEAANIGEDVKRRDFETHVLQFLDREYPDAFTHLLNKEVERHFTMIRM